MRGKFYALIICLICQLALFNPTQPYSSLNIIYRHSIINSPFTSQNNIHQIAYSQKYETIIYNNDSSHILFFTKYGDRYEHTNTFHIPSNYKKRSIMQIITNQDINILAITFSVENSVDGQTILCKIIKDIFQFNAISFPTNSPCRMVYDISKDGKTILCSPGEDYAHQQDLFKVYRYTKQDQMFQLSKTINFSGTHYNGVYYKHGIKLLKDQDSYIQFNINGNQSFLLKHIYQKNKRQYNNTQNKIKISPFFNQQHKLYNNLFSNQDSTVFVSISQEISILAYLEKQWVITQKFTFSAKNYPHKNYAISQNLAFLCIWQNYKLLTLKMDQKLKIFNIFQVLSPQLVFPFNMVITNKGDIIISDLQLYILSGGNRSLQINKNIDKTIQLSENQEQTSSSSSTIIYKLIIVLLSILLIGLLIIIIKMRYDIKKQGQIKEMISNYSDLRTDTNKRTQLQNRKKSISELKLQS